MRVAVAGATGALGRPLVRELVARGHAVVGLARSPENEPVLQALGAEPRRADLFDPAALARACAGADVVVRAATHIPRAAEATPGDWAANDRIRREGTRHLLAAAAEAGAEAYLQESIVWAARPAGGQAFDEASHPVADEVTASAVDAERLAREARGLRTATLRLGWLYGPTVHLRDMAEALRARRMPIVGRGDAPLCFLHVEDAARAFADAAERRAQGLFHVVDDQPTGFGPFLQAFAEALGAPPPRRVPALLARFTGDPWLVRFLTTPMRTTNAKFKAATGWAPAYSSVQAGLPAVAAALRAEKPS